MDKLLSVLLLLSLLVAVITGTQTQTMNSQQDLWSKYRVALIKILEPIATKLGVSPSKTVFHVNVEPEDAEWHTSKYYLNDDVALFPPRWSSAFEPISTTSDSTIPALYQKAIVKTGNPTLFLNFKRAATESYPQNPVSYPWTEVGQTLKQFVDKSNANQGRVIQFIVEEKSGQTTINSPWGVHTGKLMTSEGFVRSVTQSEDDDDLLLDNDEFGNDDDLLFRRRRRRSAPPPVITTIQVKSQKFKVDFKCQSIDGIKIKPGSWFDLDAFRQNKGKYPEYFGQNGKFPLLPSVVWVAHKPRVTIELSESEWHIYKNTWANKNTLGMSVGGAFFRTASFKAKAMDDDTTNDEDIAFYSNEDLSHMHQDEASFSVIERAVDDDDREPDQAAFNVVERPVDDDEVDEATFSVVDRPTNDDQSDLLLEEDVNEEDSDLLFRRRRRRSPPPPPPPPRVIYEKIYVASFVSTDPHPQIIAMTSEIL